MFNNIMEIMFKVLGVMSIVMLCFILLYFLVYVQYALKGTFKKTLHDKYHWHIPSPFIFKCCIKDKCRYCHANIKPKGILPFYIKEK